MTIFGCTFGPEGDQYRYIPTYLLNLLLCPLGIHGTGCRGIDIPRHFTVDRSGLRGHWHTRF
jgi:hypothetical protein